MGENPPEALTQSEAGAYFLLETLNCHRRLWLGRLSHLHQRWGGRVAPLFAHYSHTQNPLLVLLPAAGPVHTGQGSKARKAGEGLPSHSPHPKGKGSDIAMVTEKLERPPTGLRPWREPRGHSQPSTSLALPGTLITSQRSLTPKAQNRGFRSGSCVQCRVHPLL